METLTPKPKKIKLTKKQRGFVNDYVLNENGTQAVMNNYEIEGKEPEKIASVIATQNLGKLNIIDAIEVKRKTLKQALIDNGINEDKIAEKVGVLLESKDPNVIDKGLRHATNIHGIEDINDRPKNTNNYTFIFNKEAQDEIKKMEAVIKQQLINGTTQ